MLHDITAHPLNPKIQVGLDVFICAPDRSRGLTAPCRAILVSLLVALAISLGKTSHGAATPTAAGFPAAAFANVEDFGFMWWERGPDQPVYAIKTSRYALRFNTTNLTLIDFRPVADSPPEHAVLVESHTASFPSPVPASLNCKLITGGTAHTFTAVNSSHTNVHVVETGKFFQRRFHRINTPDGIEPHPSGLEVAAWPDRISFVLRLVPTRPLTNATLELQLGVADTFHTRLKESPGVALQADDGSGFVFLKSEGTEQLDWAASGSRLIARTVVADWPAGQERSVGIIVYPGSTNVVGLLALAVAAEQAPLGVAAVATLPATGRLKAAYARDMGAWQVTLPGQGTPGSDGMLRVQVAITNASTAPRTARLNFDGVPFSVIGLSAVLRDTAENPLGIPVQLSKNWHNLHPERFAGSWFHGLTMLTVPPQSELKFELVMVGHHWGGMPAATHSQLSIVGYGGNQQWDEAALGNWGEALCYDADHGLTDNDCTDARPMLVNYTNGQSPAWGVNIGGGSFLRYFDPTGSQRRHIRMRTHYQRYCPNLAEVVFAGTTDDEAADFSYSAMLFRSDDYTRGVHRLRIDVKRDFAFSRLVFFQQPGDTYSYNSGNNFVVGDTAHLTPLRQWRATFGRNEYIGAPVAFTGPMPWAMTLDSPTEENYTPANRGFLLRSWRARLDGKEGVPPYLAERSTRSASLFELVPPPGVTTLKAGDFVEVEIVRFYVPMFATNYCGPNKNFCKALAGAENSWLLGLREAVGQTFSVTTQTGSLKRLFPLQIEVANNQAEFTVTGGLGWLPVTLLGLTQYQHPIVEEKLNGEWRPINQAVHGKDFWQCDYKAGRGGWEITFNVNLDATVYRDVAQLRDTPGVRKFRFRIEHPPIISAPPTGRKSGAS